MFAVDDGAVAVNSFDDTSACFVVEVSLFDYYLRHFDSSRHVCLLLQGDGDDRLVTIPADCWILWNISSGTVRTLNVDGNLVFSDTQDIALTATYIVVKVSAIATR